MHHPLARYQRGVKYFRLQDPFAVEEHRAAGCSTCAWLFVSEDKRNALLFCTMMQQYEVRRHLCISCVPKASRECLEVSRTCFRGMFGLCGTVMYCLACS